MSKDFSFVVYDNCDYNHKKAYDRAGDPAEYIKTVNIVQVPVSNRLELDDTEYGECYSH